MTAGADAAPGAAPGPVRVVVCDDASEMRALLRWTFETGDDATVVGEAADGDAALALMAEVVADVVVLDLQMPGPPPEALLVAMTEAAPGVPIVTFSGFEPDLVAGSSASLVTLHVPKTTDLAVVRDAIVGVGRGG